MFCLDVEATAAPRFSVRVGAVSVASKLGGLKVTNDSDPERVDPHEAASSGVLAVPTHIQQVGKAEVEREGMDTCTARTAGG